MSDATEPTADGSSPAYQAPEGTTPIEIMTPEGPIMLTAVEAALFAKTHEARRDEFARAIVKARYRQAQAAAIRAIPGRDLEADERGDLKIKEQPRPFTITEGHLKHLKAAEAENNPEKYLKILRSIARAYGRTVEEVQDALIAKVATGE